MSTSISILKSLSKYQLQELVSEHPSMRSIFKTLKISYNNLSINYFNNLILEFKLEKKYLNINNHPNIIENIFENIDTIEKAYWLGFIAADGYVPSNTNMLAFTMSTKDEDHFNSFLVFINANLYKKKLLYWEV